jgi:hypothetical protein
MLFIIPNKSTKQTPFYQEMNMEAAQELIGVLGEKKIPQGHTC